MPKIRPSATDVRASVASAATSRHQRREQGREGGRAERGAEGLNESDARQRGEGRAGRDRGPQRAAGPGDPLAEQRADRAEVIVDSESVRLRIAVAQIAATLQNLTVVNQLRQSLGITTSQCEAETLAECDAAFGLLENGLSDVTDRPAG